MKKMIFATMVAITYLLAVSCGNQTGSKGNNEGGVDPKAAGELTKEVVSNASKGDVVGYNGDAGTALKTIDTNNYAPIVKGIYGVEFPPQEGWTVYKVESLNKVNDAHVTYTIDGEVDTEPLRKAFVEHLIGISDDGLYLLDMDYNTLKISKGEKLGTYEDFKAKASGKTLYYKHGEKGVQATVHTAANAKKSMIEYTLVLVSIM